jgi:hypothetical protein
LGNCWDAKMGSPKKDGSKQAIYLWNQFENLRRLPAMRYVQGITVDAYWLMRLIGWFDRNGDQSPFPLPCKLWVAFTLGEWCTTSHGHIRNAIIFRLQFWLHVFSSGRIKHDPIPRGRGKEGLGYVNDYH